MNEAQARLVYFLTWFFLYAGLTAFSFPGHAHVLNMTEAHFLITEKDLQLELEIDLSRAYGDRFDYYQASIEQPCALLGDGPVRINDILSQIGLVVQAAGAPGKKEVFALEKSSTAENTRSTGPSLPLYWSDISCQFSTSGRASYLDQFSWPKVFIQARSTVLSELSNPESIKAVFQYGFPFEEPISVTFRMEEQERKMTRWLIAGQSSPNFPLAERDVVSEVSSQDLSFYLKQGFVHIVPKGLDHILFVVALIFTTTGAVRRLKYLSIFTVAHSVSMAAMVWNIASFDSVLAEILIALTIVWMGIDCTGKLKIPKLKVPIVFVFGLIHGLGFANILSELTLPYSGAFLALVGFNLGVELGQLTVVSILLCLLLVIARFPIWLPRLKLFFSSVALFFGLFWTMQRVMQL